MCEQSKKLWPGTCHKLMLFYRYSVMLIVFALAVSRSRDCLCMIGLLNASLILFFFNFAVASYHGLINTHSVKDSMGSTTVSSPSSPSNSKNESHIR